ncbi:MAG: TonB-dependent receptor [Bacteroidales bacterium]|nr:TonB-dependent receptor [Bacteroidales bacterium]
MRFTFLFILYCFTLSIATAGETLSQEKDGKDIRLSFTDASVISVIEALNRQTGYSFFYDESHLSKINHVTIRMENVTLQQALTQISQQTRLHFYKVNNTYTVVPPFETGETGASPQNRQQQGITVAGTVTDLAGEALPGANVTIKGTVTGVVSDMNGKYSITVPDRTAILSFSFIGYVTREITVGDQKNIDVSLSEDATELEEVVVVGYGTQRKATLTGAVASIKGAEIVKTKNENVQNMLTGKVPGVRVWQRTSEPGDFNNVLDIRGMGTPLIVIDGIPSTMENFQRLNPNDVDDMSVLKDASAAIYGIRAANGVVLVTTKRGQLDKAPELTYSGSFTFQKPSGLPSTFDIFQWMTIINEQQMHNINGGTLRYTEADFEAYRDGTQTGTDWYDAVFGKFAPQTEHNLTVTGGTAKTTYHVGFGYLYQGGFFKSGDLNYDRFNLRSNITTKITDRLTFDLNTNLLMDTKNQANVNTWDIFKRYWRQGPHIPVWADPEETRLFYGLIEGDNVYAWTRSDLMGYRRYSNKWIETSASLKYDIPGVEGLSIRGLFNYNYRMSDNGYYKKTYTLYSYESSTDTYKEHSMNSPMTMQKQSYTKMQWLSQFILNYNRNFGVHGVGGTLVWETQKRDGDNFNAQRNLPLPLDHLFAGLPDDQVASMSNGTGDLYSNANMALAGRVNYAYAGKYLLELQFRYDGSSKFGSGHRWGFFPSVSAGWRISEEEFFKNSPLSFINHLKLRTSYGVMGDGDNDALAYQFISGYEYPPVTDRSDNNRYRADGYMLNGSFTKSAKNKGIPNPILTWFEARTFDIGVDMEAWNGLLGVGFDYFSRHREGLLARRTGGIPTVVGATLPQENLNSDRTFGLELELSHRNRINNDLSYGAKLITTVTRVKNLYVERAADGSSYSNWKNNTNDRMAGRWYGYGYDRQFTSWDEIWNSPVRIGNNTILGDYLLEDWNGDGEINDQDKYFVLYNGLTNQNMTPFLNFSLSLNCSWKSFDLNALFQGSALCSVIYGEQFTGTADGNSNSMSQFYDRWHPVDPAADPYDPATQWVSGYYAYSGTNINAESAFNAVNGAYLRLKSIELGYTLPSFSFIKNLRVYANAYNLLTITKVRDVDPEHPGQNNDYGYMYPLNKTLTFGLNLTF